MHPGGVDHGGVVVNMKRAGGAVEGGGRGLRDVTGTMGGSENTLGGSRKSLGGESGPVPRSVVLRDQGTEQGMEVEIRARWQVAKHLLGKSEAGFTGANENMRVLAQVAGEALSGFSFSAPPDPVSPPPPTTLSPPPTPACRQVSDQRFM